jgi:hypothetical protein
MECKECGGTLSSTDRFCQSCGSPVVKDPEVRPAGEKPPAVEQEVVEPQAGDVQAAGQAGIAPPSEGPVSPPPSQASTARPRVSGWAVASLVMGILGWSCLFFVGGVFAIIFGAVARHEIKKSDGTVGGNGLAIAGLVLGTVVVGVMVICAAVFFPLSLLNVGPTRTITRTVQQGAATSVGASLDIRNGSLTVGGGATELMRGEFTYNVKDWQPQIVYDGASARGNLSVKQGGAWNWTFWRTRNDWDIHFKDGVPMDLTVNLHAGDSAFNMGTVALTGFNANSNAGNINADFTGVMPLLNRVSANTNAGNVSLYFGGTYSRPVNLSVGNDAGNIDVSLIGTWRADVTGTIEGSAGNVTLKLPSDVGVIVSAESSFGNVEANGLKKSSASNSYVNSAYGKSPVTLRLNVHTAAGNVRLTVAQ